MSGADLAEKLLCLLFPAHCLLCDDTVSAGEIFCDSCKEDMPRRPLIRHYTLQNGEKFAVMSRFEYRGGFRETLHRLKFENEHSLAKPIGRIMAEMLAERKEFNCVTWAAMSKSKKRERGYDQSELLAKAVAKSLGLPCLPLIEKIRETDTQHELPREKRSLNIKNAYRAHNAAGMAVILVDDIITTGSTVCECANELYKAGAKKVLGLCAADTPETSHEEAGE